MKLAPIRNPHAKTSKVENLTKMEEKMLGLQKTKQEVIERYNRLNDKRLKKPVGAATTGTVGVK